MCGFGDRRIKEKLNQRSFFKGVGCPPQFFCVLPFHSSVLAKARRLGSRGEGGSRDPVGPLRSARVSVLFHARASGWGRGLGVLSHPRRSVGGGGRTEQALPFSPTRVPAREPRGGGSTGRGPAGLCESGARTPAGSVQRGTGTPSQHPGLRRCSLSLGRAVSPLPLPTCPLSRSRERKERDPGQPAGSLGGRVLRGWRGSRDGRVGGSCFVPVCRACSKTSLVRFTGGMDLPEAQRERAGGPGTRRPGPWEPRAVGLSPQNRECHSSFCVMFPLEKPFC